MRVVFMGSPEFAVPCLRALAAAHEVALVVSQPDKPAGRGGQLTPPAVKVAALELGLPVLQPKSARTGELATALAESRAELAVVVAYGKILPRAVLDALPRGCINVHASLLPKYRGAAPVQWAVIDGEPETGVAIMQLDEGMDTGPVLLERRVSIDPDETSGELLVRLAPIGAAALLEAIAMIEAGTATPVAQDHARATHAQMLAKSHGAIDFAQPAAKVASRIRGVDPWPGAQAMLRGQVVKLFRATPSTSTGTSTGGTSTGGTSTGGTSTGGTSTGGTSTGGTSTGGTSTGGTSTGGTSTGGTSTGGPSTGPGTVVAVDANGLHVTCGDGALVVIREVQAPGRKRLTAQQFAAGRGVAVGDVLSKPEVAA